MRYVGFAERVTAVSAAGGVGIITRLTRRARVDFANYLPLKTFAKARHGGCRILGKVAVICGPY